MRSKTSFIYSVSEIGRKFTVVSEPIGVKAGVLVHPVRLACTGNPSGPSLYHLLEVMGKERVMGRIEKALADFR